MSPWLDLRTGARALRATPGQALAAVLALALGVAAAVSLYTVSRVVADDLPPIPHPERVARLYFADETMPSGRRGLRASDAGPLVDQVADRVVVAMVDSADIMIEVEGCAAQTAPVTVEQVGQGFFAIAAVAPQVGRAWTADELSHRAPAILSADLWRRACAAEPGVVGRTLWVDRRPHEILGVMPDGFWLSGHDVAAWLPLDRVKPDSSPMVLARLTGAGSWQDVNDRFAAAGANDRGLALALTDPTVRRGRIALVAVLGPALLVLLVACGNAAALLTGRALQRQRDLAVRLSIGATPWRLARQAFAESTLVAGAAGLAALPLAAAGTWALRRMFSIASPSMARAITVDLGAVAVGLLFVCATAFLAGLLPALRAARADVTALLSRRPGSIVVARGRYTAADLLLVLQVGMAVTLLVVTAMFMRLVGEITAGVPGPLDRTFIAEAGTPEGNAPDGERLRRVVADLRAVPGVIRVAVVDHPPEPPEPRFGTPVEALDAPPGVGRCHARVSAVTADYFGTFSLSLRAGNLFTGWEPATAPRVAVVSEGLARQCWGRAEAVGRELRLGRTDEAPWLVIGVVGDLLPATRIRPRPVEVYVPFTQLAPAQAILLVEARSAAGLVDRLSAATTAAALKPPLWRTMAEEKARLVDQLHLLPGVLQALAAIALVLATLGVYASILQSLARDRRGLAIRLTLGARPARLVAAGVSRQGLLALIGILAGVIVTMAATKQMFAGLLVMTSSDPRLWAAVCAPLLACGVLAALGPTIRIVRLDPMAILRRADE